MLGIGSAHVGEFGGQQAIADAKAEIVRALPEDGVAILNADDPLVAAMATETKARVLTFGTGKACNVRAIDPHVDASGCPHFLLHHGPDQAHVALRHVHGRHNATNALAAAATALAAGVPFDLIVAGLHVAKLSSGGRMEHRPDGVTIINDAFNASPESVLAALDALADIAGTGRRRVAVLGEMAELGDDALDWHTTIARRVVTTGVNRTIGVGSHHVQHMITTISDGGLTAAIADPKLSLAEHVNAQLQPHDVVLIKGANALGLEAVARELAALHSS